MPTQGLPKPAQEPVTVDEMRQAILRAARDDATIHNAMMAADYRGVSGEDRYVLLAYYSLRRVHDLEQRTLRWLDCHPAPSTLTAGAQHE